jgi:hypothetical protein
MLFVVKLFHTVVFVIISAAILYVWYAIFTGTTGLLLTIAVGLIMLEILVYLGNGLRCPLTKLALRYGDTTGNDYIADIFLPRWSARLIPLVCGSLAFVGLIVLLVQLRLT